MIYSRTVRMNFVLDLTCWEKFDIMIFFWSFCRQRIHRVMTSRLLKEKFDGDSEEKQGHAGFSVFCYDDA